MYNQGSEHEKIDMTPTTPSYPQPELPGGTMAPPAYPSPQPQPGHYPPPQPMASGYPPPVQHQPTTTMHNTSTTVVIQQQPAAVVVQGPRGWSSGICACFEDCGVCKSGRGGAVVRTDLCIRGE